jgi:hypothetical protein
MTKISDEEKNLYHYFLRSAKGEAKRGEIPFSCLGCRVNYLLDLNARERGKK